MNNVSAATTLTHNEMKTVAKIRRMILFPNAHSLRSARTAVNYPNERKKSTGREGIRL